MHKPSESLNIFIETIKKALAEDEIGSLLSPSVFLKGRILLCEGEVSNSLYFIKKGIIRAYKKTEGAQEIDTTWLAAEGEIAGCVESFFFRKPSRETIETLEESTVYRISYDWYDYQSSSNLQIANMFIRLLTAELSACERRLEMMKVVPVAARIDRYLTDTFYPNFHRRIPDHYIASFLGTTPATFSRQLSYVNRNSLPIND